MFQYAFACKLKYLYPSEEILIDLTDFKGYGWHNFELKYVFGVEMPVATPFQIFRFTLPISTNTGIGQRIHRYFGRFFNRRIYTEKKENYFTYTDEPLLICGSCYYDGTWFNEGYFSDIRDKIYNTFSFRRTLSAYCESVMNEIMNTNSVSIHVRRGNYLLFDTYKGICDKEYYKRAIEYVAGKIQNPHFFFFSDDIQWCRENLSELTDKYSFVENNNPQDNYVDMQLMSCCKHNIIAHSSFSWWGAWLNRNPDRIVVAPYKWVNSNVIRNKPQLKDWILIDHNQC